MKRREFILKAATAAAVGTSILYLERLDEKKHDCGQDVLKDQFENAVINASRQDGGRLVIFESGASWCGACQILKPELNALVQASSYENKPVAWIRTDIGDWETSRAFAQKWGITGIPHVGVFYNGREVPNSVFRGALDRHQLKEWLENVKHTIKEAPVPPAFPSSKPGQNTAQAIYV